jgi:hypothetical protein
MVRNFGRLLFEGLSNREKISESGSMSNIVTFARVGMRPKISVSGRVFLVTVVVVNAAP